MASIKREEDGITREKEALDRGRAVQLRGPLTRCGRTPVGNYTD